MWKKVERFQPAQAEAEKIQMFNYKQFYPASSTICFCNYHGLEILTISEYFQVDLTHPRGKPLFCAVVDFTDGAQSKQVSLLFSPRLSEKGTGVGRARGSFMTLEE